MSAPFSLHPAVPTSNEAMRAVMRSFDEEAPPFMAHRAELAALAALSVTSRPRKKATRGRSPRRPGA